MTRQGEAGMRGTREERTPVDPGRTAGEGKASSAERAGVGGGGGGERKDIRNPTPGAVTMKSFQHSGIRVRPAALKMAGKPGTLKQWEDRGLSELALILSQWPASSSKAF